MIVSGEFAAGFDAVRLDSFENANKGPLLSADEDTGQVVYKDRTGAEVFLTLGQHTIKLVAKR